MCQNRYTPNTDFFVYTHVLAGPFCMLQGHIVPCGCFTALKASIAFMSVHAGREARRQVEEG